MTPAFSASLERRAWAVGVLLLVVLVALDRASGHQINGVYAAAAVLVAIDTGPGRTAVVAALAVVAAAASGVWNHNLGHGDWTIRFLSCVLLSLIAVVAADLTTRRRRRLEHTTQLAQRVLDALAVELTGARTVREVAEGFVGHAVGVLGASSAMVMSLDGDGMLRSVTWHGRTGDGADQYQEIPVDSDLPGAVAVRQGADLHYRSVKEIEAVMPVLAGYYPSDRSLHLLPLRREGTTYGLLALTFPPDLFTAAEDGFLHSLAGALSSAVRRAGELQAADAATQRTALLDEASMTLSRSLDLETTLGEVGRLLVPRFADWVTVQLLRDHALETVLVQHRDPATTEWARGMRGAFPVDMDAPTGAPQVVRSGRSELYPFIPAEVVERAARDEDHLALLRRLGFTSAIIAPLVGRQGVLGAVTLIQAESGRSYGEEDLAFLEEMADRIAVALDTAASFEQQSERLAGVMQVAEVAQRAILAPPPPRTGPLRLSARYLSAAVEAQVGGDLYEIVPGTTSVRLLVGDVRGKGLSAVRTATVVIGEFRAAAADTGDVCHVAREVDRRIQPYLPDPEDFVTGVIVDIDHAGHFTVVTCGHPAPVLLPFDGEPCPLVLDAAPPFGLGCEPVATTGTLRRGDRLLLFTDGLIEARSPTGDFIDPMPLLSDLARADFPTALDGLLTALQRAAGHALDDDLALLLACYDPE
ncbi:GAF domain-containing SpoIIE family protein phosphatase [Nocardioides marmoribigeumensis]|uniref:Serine phosphatase RsbU (Regulator of sigma subunit) n=1 Tax=Nocardioides marmoribigeumensis TaxID=433649 RepID=A0ABU2BY13_9ACTN|nr:SpoIIE family protein phosphatase [Nocardioides marmoribigeumensis]MDR7363289.1 serine phosphatase RsbU (regulator of sigma subunit) [Nocardioides marmoribigeumensis]